jgi:hypothetical protein
MLPGHPGVYVGNSTFGVTSGIRVAHSTADINLFHPQVWLDHVILASTTEVGTNFNTGNANSFIQSSNHDQVSGAFKVIFPWGILTNDTTIFNTATPSIRMTPSSATIKLKSAPVLSGSWRVAVASGATAQFSVNTRKSVVGDGAAYNGAEPRLIVRRNYSCGITADTVLDTMVVAAGSWEQLTGTTAAASSDCVMEFVVDCDGTAGWINVDDSASTTVTDSAGQKFSYFGLSIFQPNNTAGGGGASSFIIVQ